MKKLRNGVKGRGVVAQKKSNAVQAEQGKAFDELIVYEEWKNSFLPLLRKLLADGVPADKIRKHFAPVIQAAMVQKALKGDFKAMKDILDRHEGMPIQRINQTSITAQMGHDELAALVAQKAKDVGLDKILEAKFKVMKEKDESNET